MCFKSVKKESRSSAGESPPIRLVSADESNTSDIKKGIIKKWTNVFGGFKRRFFVLTQDALAYYSVPEKGGKEKGQFALKLAQFELKDNYGKPGFVDVVDLLVNTGLTQICLRFQTIEEREEWFESIIKQQNKVKQGSHGFIFEKEQNPNREKLLKETLNFCLEKNIIKV